MASVVVVLMVMMRLFFVAMAMMLFLFLMAVAMMLFLFLMAVAMMRFLVLVTVAVMRFLVLVTVAVMRFLVLVAMAVRRFLLMTVAMMRFLLRSCRADRCRAIEVGHIMVMIFMSCIQNDIEITARNAGFLDAGDLHHETVRGDGIQRAFQRLRVCPEVNHRCDEHISADAGGSFKV